MATLEEIVEELESLTPESLSELALMVEYLKWKQSEALAQTGGRAWVVNLIELFRSATTTSDHDTAGMEVRVGEAVCDAEPRMALWEHPPVHGAASVEFQVPVAAEIRNLRLSFATGIRDGSRLAGGNVVAFRIFVNGWRLWSDTQHTRAWRQHEIALPALSGDVARIQFITDGLGNHEWAWAVWGEPQLIGEIRA